MNMLRASNFVLRGSLCSFGRTHFLQESETETERACIYAAAWEKCGRLLGVDKKTEETQLLSNSCSQLATKRLGDTLALPPLPQYFFTKALLRSSSAAARKNSSASPRKDKEVG